MIESSVAGHANAARNPTANFLLDSGPHRVDTYLVGEMVYLSLGSNLADREANLRAAIAQLEPACKVKMVSGVYETEPVDVVDQSWFLNCVVAIETEFAPRDLLKFLLEIEQLMGRVRSRQKGPRKIDMDILLFGDRVIDEPGLTIPHLEMHRRRFVLHPLAEIAGEARHPVLHKTARELLASLAPGQIVRRLNSPAGGVTKP